MSGDTVQNDTYGEITRAELADLRRVALRCQFCGMLATVDPVMHESRYGHAPVITEGRGELIWRAGAWRTRHCSHVGSRTIRDVNGNYPAMPFARCSCGWEGPGRLDRADAETDLEGHRAEVARGD